MSRLERLRKARLELFALRGAQDQTMRCGVNSIVFGADRDDGMNETQRALEWWIAFVDKAIADHLTDLFDEE